MEKNVVISFSSEKKYLNRLLNEIADYFNHTSVQSGFESRAELLQFLAAAKFKTDIYYIFLDISELDEATLKFLNTINSLSPNAIKLVTSESSQLLLAQKTFSNSNSFCFMNRPSSKDDFKIAFNSVTNTRLNRELILKFETKLNDNDLNAKKPFSEIAHDLKSPFTALLGISDILISDWNELSNDEKLELVKGIKLTSKNAYEMVEKLLSESNTSPKD
jgi:hypothetical protein